MSSTIMVNATDTRNWILKTPLNDCLKLRDKVKQDDFIPLCPLEFNPGINTTKHAKKKPATNQNRRKKPRSTFDFRSYIIQKGLEFEEEIVHKLSKKFKVKFVSDRINTESIELTKKYMKEGIPIIHSAPMRDNKSRTQGIADLLIRSDYLKKIFAKDPIPDIKKSSNMYYVVDIKFSTLSLCSDGVHMLNRGNVPSYKAQLFIYNRILNKIQRRSDTISFILGRGVKFVSGGIENYHKDPFYTLGVVDFDKRDHKYVAMTNESVKWVREVRCKSHKWDLTKPDRKELYPNMCKNNLFKDIKKTLSEQVGEITKVWQCGTRHRDISHSKGVFSWENPKFNSSLVDIKGERGRIIDSILRVNRDENPESRVLPKKIDSNLYNWRDEVTEAFVDFETINDLSTNKVVIFMIGVWSKNPRRLRSSRSLWSYHSFTAKDLSPRSELEIMLQFYHMYRHHRLWYWVAEDIFFSKSLEKLHTYFSAINDKGRVKKIRDMKSLEWRDLAKLIKTEPVVVKGCMNFKLKEFSKALYDNGCISTKIPEGADNIKDGLSASIQAERLYTEKVKNVRVHPVMTSIMEYNKFDVNTLWEILNYLREKH